MTHGFETKKIPTAAAAGSYDFKTSSCCYQK
jgi:hypothetical protein